MGNDVNDFLVAITSGPELVEKIRAVCGLNAFNFILQVDYLFNI